MRATLHGATTTRSRLDALARLIQFRSELAILAVLALGVGAGALARIALPGGGPPAVIAAPTPSAATHGAPDERPGRAGLPAPASTQPAPKP